MGPSWLVGTFHPAQESKRPFHHLGHCSLPAPPDLVSGLLCLTQGPEVGLYGRGHLRLGTHALWLPAEFGQDVVLAGDGGGEGEDGVLLSLLG